MKVKYHVTIIFTLFLLMTSGVGWYVVNISETALEDSINKETLIKASSIMELIDKTIYERIDIFEEYTRDLIFQDALRSSNRMKLTQREEILGTYKETAEGKRLKEEITEKLDYYHEQYGQPLFMGVLVLDSFNRQVAQVGEDEHEVTYVCEVLESGEKIKGIKPTPCVYHAGREGTHLDVSFPVLSESKEVIGTVYLAISIQSILHDLVGSFSRSLEYNDPLANEIFVADAQGHLIYSSGPEVLGQDIGWMYEMKTNSQYSQNGFVITMVQGGQENQYVHSHSRGYRDFKGVGWSVIIKHSLNELFSPIRTLRYMIVAAVFGVMLLGVVMMLSASRLIVQPILELKGAADKVTKGEFSLINLKAYGEMGELVQTFNTMATEVKNSRVQIIEEMHRSENARLELRENEERLEAITNNAQDAIFMVDPKERIIFSNPTASKIFGYSKSELQGRNIYDLIVHESVKDENMKGLDLLRKSDGGPIMGRTVELEAHNKEGKEFIVDLSISSVYYKNQWHAIVIMRDISERKVNETRLRQQEELMIAQSRQAAMGEMISMIAHQWRQPLTTMGLTIDNMILDIDMGENRSEEMKQSLRQINMEIQYLSRTIDDFRGFMRPEKEVGEVDLNEQIRLSRAIIDKSLQSSNITVKEELHIKTKPVTYPNEVIQVVLNLLNNAKEALEEQQVSEPMIYLRSSEDERAWNFAVCDNGAGVPEEIVQKIFEPYFTTKELNGTGLGLYMSKVIVEKHLKGLITYRKEGNRACFEVMIPKNRQKKRPG